MKDLDQLIDRANAGYSARYSKALLDELMFAGDPLADAAVAALHERSYDRAADKLAGVRALAKEGVRAAKNFVDATSAPPDWLDRNALAAGQKITLGFVALTRLSLLHSLFAGGIFARATLVTRATGRLGADPATRIRETGAFIAAILQPGGLEPGAIGYDTTLRVRLLHGSIRAWLKRTADFSRDYVGEPIDQTMLAMTLGLFSYLNLRSFARLGASFSDGECEAHQHMWRTVGWLLGVDDRLLAHSLRQEQELWCALVAHQAFPDDWGAGYLDESVATSAALTDDARKMQPFFRSLFLHLSGSRWFGVAEEARLDPRLAALRVANAATSLRRRWIPGASNRMAVAGLQTFDKAVTLARTHDYGLRIESAPDSERAEAALRSVAAAVRERFAGLAQNAV